MATEPGENQVEYIVADLDILNALDSKKPDRGHRQETWEQARERVSRLPEPLRTQQLELLDKWQRE